MRTAKVKTKGANAKPPMRPKMQPCLVLKKIQLSFKKKPVRLQIPPPSNYKKYPRIEHETLIDMLVFSSWHNSSELGSAHVT